MTFFNFTFQDPSPLISYSSGQWMEGNPTNDSLAQDYSQESFKVTSDAGATATLTFVGTGITLYGAKRPNHGNYSVLLDDEQEFVGDGNGDNVFQVPLWNAQNLSNSQHTVIATNKPSSHGLNFFDLDFVSVGRELGPPNYDGHIFYVTIDDESPFVVYNSSQSWAPLFSSTASNFSLHQTKEEGASFSLFFQGSSIELYGLYVNAPFQVNLDNQLPRELAGPDVSLENTIFEHAQTLLYYADGLDENQTHVVTLTNTVGDPARPFFFDFAIVRSSQNFSGDTPSPDSAFTVPTSSASTLTSSSTLAAPSSSNIVVSRSRPTPVAAVVGGVVGGAGAVLILTLIAFIIIRRKRSHTSYSPPGPRRAIEDVDDVQYDRRTFRPPTIRTFETVSQSYDPPTSVASASRFSSRSSLDNLDFVGASRSVAGVTSSIGHGTR